MSGSNDGSGNILKQIGENICKSYFLGEDVHEATPAEYEYVENDFALPNDTAVVIADAHTFNLSPGGEVLTNGIGQSGALDQHRLNRGDGGEEFSHGEEGLSNGGVSGGVIEVSAALVGGMPPEVAGITRQAKIHLEAALDETRALANGLFGELSKFLGEAVSVQKDFDQVHMAVQSEYERLDSLQPTVQSATRDILMNPGASLL